MSSRLNNLGREFIQSWTEAKPATVRQWEAEGCLEDLALRAQEQAGQRLGELVAAGIPHSQAMEIVTEMYLTAL